MTSRWPYWCPKTMKRLPCWCPKPISGSRTLFFCKRFLLFQQICIDAGHVSENTLYGQEFFMCVILVIWKQLIYYLLWKTPIKKKHVKVMIRDPPYLSVWIRHCKKIFLHKKKVQLSRTGSGNQHGERNVILTHSKCRHIHQLEFLCCCYQAQKQNSNRHM